MANSDNSLKQTLIKVGLVCSILTALVGAGKEVVDVTKEWSSPNKAQIEQLHNDLNALSQKFEEKDLKQQRINLSLKQQIFDLRVAGAYAGLATVSKPMVAPLIMAGPSPSLIKVEELAMEVAEATKASNTTSMAPTSMAPSSSMKFGWLMGIIGLACCVIFGVLHFINKKRPLVTA